MGKLKKHKYFKDVAWDIVSVRSYKPGFITIKFYWVNLKGDRILDQLVKREVDDQTWGEFSDYEINNRV